MLIIEGGSVMKVFMLITFLAILVMVDLTGDHIWSLFDGRIKRDYHKKHNKWHLPGKHGTM
ncbi:MAG: hypothetical protein PUE94_05280, partial [Lachnospiraceae bacterium]|jgi:CDP-diglyceride synthetase|nr:hypothetical protein [Lachnospiraceae bacterium]